MFVIICGTLMRPALEAMKKSEEHQDKKYGV